jgi:hypothetical protein
MGEIAARDADLAIVTSDNPRTEDPAAIVSMILEGVRRTGARELPAGDLARADRGYHTEIDRRPGDPRGGGGGRPRRRVVDCRKGSRGLPDPGDHEGALRRSRGSGGGAGGAPVSATAATPAPASRSFEFAARAMGATIVHAGKRGATFAGAAYDGRSVAARQLFFALPGERADGFDFAGQAAAAGAAGVVVAAARGVPAGCDDVAVLAVDDPRRALGDLARAVRAEFQGRVVGVTGSNGKTTTREMCAAALRPLGPVWRGRQLQTTDIGLPLTILAAAGNEARGCGDAMRGARRDRRAGRHRAPHIASSPTSGGAPRRLGSIEGVARAKGRALRRPEPDGRA